MQTRLHAVLDRATDFPGFDGWTYLNCAYHGPMPSVAEEALIAAMELRRNPALLLDEYHFTFPNAYRDAIGGLIGAPAEDIALTDSTTHGIMLLVGGLDWQAGDEVVLPQGEFPANRLPWLSLAGRGVTTRFADIGSGASAVDGIEAALTERTRVLSLGWVRYSDGRRLELDSISRLCRDRGVLFVVDASQGVGGLPFDLRETPCDLLACSGYKWLLGPYGLGFAYVQPELGRRLVPPNVNWFAAEGATNFNRLADLPLALRPGAMRFDINETANFLNVAAATAAARYVVGIGPAAIEAHCRALHERLIEGLPSGFLPLGDPQAGPRSNILCIGGPDPATTAAVVAFLRQRRIAVSSRENSIRVSPHVYNDAADVDRFVEALREAAGAKPGTARSVAGSGPVGEPVTDCGPARRPERGTRRGPTISLCDIDPQAHLDDLYDGSHGTPEKEAVWTYMLSGPFESREAFADVLRRRSVETDPFFLSVVDNRSGRALGMVSYLRIVAEQRSIELGHIWYTPAAQRTGVNTEAIYLMLREAFDELGYRRVEWKCHALNARSRRAALRLGFRFEGIFRQHVIAKGRNRDTAWFSIIDSEWPDLRQRMERWLAAPPESRAPLNPGSTAARRLRELLALRPLTGSAPPQDT